MAPGDKRKSNQTTSKQRTKKFRESLRTDPERYEAQKRKDRERKRLKKLGMNSQECEALQARNNIALKAHRERKKSKPGDVVVTPQASGSHGFTRISSLTRAVQRTKSTLPKSPRKRACVIDILTKENQPPNTKTCSSTPVSAENQNALQVCVQQFYLKDDITYQDPGKKKFVKEKIHGTVVKHQMKYLLFTISEAHQLFLIDHPEKAISYSHFAALRPKHCKYMSSIPENVCVCVHHENIRLLLKALRTTNSEFPVEFRLFIDRIVCSSLNESCMMKSCDACIDKINLLEPTCDGNRIMWEQWQNNEKIDESGTVLDCFMKLKSLTADFLCHTFVKRSQHAYFEIVKAEALASSDVALLQIDFAENYKYVEQDAVQGMHWVNKMATVFTGYIWSGLGGKSIVIVSDHNDHSKYTVGYYLKHLIIPNILSYVVGLKKLIIFSDGAASQFKSRYTLRHTLGLGRELGIDIEWCFFASYHGKGVVDGVGGTAKRIAFEYSKVPGNRCRNEAELYTLLDKKMPNTWIFLPVERNWEGFRTAFEKKFPSKGTPEIHNVKRCHIFKAGEGDELITSSFYRATLPPTPQPPTLAKTPVLAVPENKGYKVNDNVVVDYEGSLFPGTIKSVECAGATVSVMTKCLPTGWKWPQPPDTILYFWPSIKCQITGMIIPQNARGVYRVDDEALEKMWGI